jgi:hypothetical protein
MSPGGGGVALQYLPRTLTSFSPLSQYLFPEDPGIPGTHAYIFIFHCIGIDIRFLSPFHALHQKCSIPL